MMKRLAVLIGMMAIWAFSPAGLNAQYRQIIVATGSPFELGLVDEPGNSFKKQFGCEVRCIKTPTGPGLELGRQGLTHITMGHHREATQKFKIHAPSFHQKLQCYGSPYPGGDKPLSKERRQSNHGGFKKYSDLF